MSRMDGGGPPAPKPIKVKRAAPKVVRRSSPPPVTDVQSSGGYGPKPSKPARTVRKTSAPVTDAQSSGGDYGSRKASAFKQTKPYKRAVAAASNAQLTKQPPTVQQVLGLPPLTTRQASLQHQLKVLMPIARYEIGQDTKRANAEANVIANSDPFTQVGHALQAGVHGERNAILWTGYTARNLIRRLQGSTGPQEASVFPADRVAQQAAQNLPVDFANTVVNAIPAATHVGGELVHGKFGQAGKELAQPYVDLVKHPEQSLIEHPFSTAALVTGPLRGLTRGAGAVARRGVLGRTAKAAASTDRAPAVVEGTRLVEPRRYSPDPVGKALQVLKEKGKVPFTAERKAVKLRKAASEMDAAGNHMAAADLRHEAAQSAPTRMTEDQVKRRVDEIRDTNEVVRRQHAKRVSQQVHAATRNRQTVAGKVRRVRAEQINPTAAVSLVAQKIVHPTLDDLRTYQSELERAHATGDLTPSQRLANEQLRSQIQRALDHPQDMRLVQAAADKYRAIERPITQQLERHGMLDPAETAKRREMPFAARHLNATRDSTPRLTDAGTARLVVKAERAAQARRVVRAQRTVDNTRVALERAQREAIQPNGASAVSETRPLPVRSIAGRKVTAAPGQGVRDMLRWIDQVDQRDPTVIRSAHGKQVGASPADRVRRAIVAHDEATAVLKRERQAGRDLRARARAVRKATTGKPLRRAPGWVDEHGRPLTTEQMRMERELGAVDAATGKVTRTPLPGEPAFVSHAPNLTRPGSFYRDSGRPVSAGSKAFTGGSVTKGTFDASDEALHASARRLQSLLDAHEGHLAFLDETAMRDGSGKPISGDRTRVEAAIERATKDSRGHTLPGARKWRIVRVSPFGSRQSQLDQLLNSLNDHGELHSNAPGGTNPVVAAVEDALRGRGDGPFMAIPEEAAVRLEEHLRMLGSHSGQVWNVINSLWRKNVLAFSPKWAASNIGEATERSLIAGVRPGDRALVTRAITEWKKTDPAAAERFLATIGSGHFGFVRGNERYATAREFTDPTRNGPFIRFAARVAGSIDRTPVVDWLPKVYGAWTGHVMDYMGRIEAQFRMAIAGKKLRDITQSNRTFADLSEKGLAQALQGLRETPTQIEVARFTRNAYGQYEAFSPAKRRWIATYTPFAAWAFNAARFLLITLPRDHPIVTATAADLTRSQEKWLRDIGFWMGQRDTLPGYLLGDVPMAGGGLLKVGRYTPQSLAADFPDTVAGLVLPSGQNILMALRGLDPFGNPLRESKTSAVLQGLLGLVVPGPIAPRASGSNTVLDTLNPVQVIPASKVAYARVKTTLDRINSEIQQMPQSAKTKRPDGTYPPKYAALLKQRSDLTNERKVLLVKSGVQKDPALNVEQELRRLNAQAAAMKKAGKATENGGYETKAYAALRARIRTLEKQRAKLLKTPKAKVVRIKPRPLTPDQQMEREYQHWLREQKNPEQQMEDEYNRWLEQQKVASGG